MWPRRSPGQRRAPHPRPSQPWSFSACDTVPQEGAGRLDGAEGAGACAAAPRSHRAPHEGTSPLRPQLAVWFPLIL